MELDKTIHSKNN